MKRIVSYDSLLANFNWPEHVTEAALSMYTNVLAIPVDSTNTSAPGGSDQT